MAFIEINGVPLVGYFGLPADDKSDRKIAEYLEDNLACGWNQLTLCSDLMRDLLDHPERVASVRKLFDSFGATCRCAHAACNDRIDAGEEMCLPFDGDRTRMLERCRRTLEYSALFGADTCVFHLEPDMEMEGRPTHSFPDWVSYVEDALERLLPVAEQYGVVIALENIWTSLSCGATLDYFCRRFPSPWLGLCYDSGHANIMVSRGNLTCNWLPGHELPAQECRLGDARPGAKPMTDTDGFRWNEHYLDQMLANIVTTHLHANYTIGDNHDLPTCGNLDWKTVLAKLATAPRLRTHQHEVSIAHGYSAQLILGDFMTLLSKV